MERPNKNEKIYGYVMGYVCGDNDRNGSLHLACSTDGKHFTALNSGEGILYAKSDTDDGNKTLSTGNRFAGIALCRDENGCFEVIAPCGRDETVLYVYSSGDLITFSDERLVGSHDEGYEAYREKYDTACSMAATWVNRYGTVSGMTASGMSSGDGGILPEGAKGISIIGVTRDEYDAVISRFAPEDGACRNMEEQLYNTARDNEYDNPFIMQRADPHIFYDEDSGYYYFTASYPAYNDIDHGYDRIILRRAESVEGLADSAGGIDKELTIWMAPKKGLMAKHVWAPEIHRIKGRWYVFFAAGSSDNVWAIRPYVLVCQNNGEPYSAGSWRRNDGTYEIHAATSRDSAYFKNMSLDMTYFENAGKHYVIWADIIGQSALYMQQIDPDNPWIGISDKVIMLTTPEYGWERENERVNEGPGILKHDGKIFCTFSASGTGPEYCVGLLYADGDSDLMDAASWTKLGYPVLTSADVPGEYGPGHNSFTADADGNPLIVYHARPEECYNRQCEWAEAYSLYDPCRHARVRNVRWTEDGMPFFRS